MTIFQKVTSSPQAVNTISCLAGRTQGVSASGWVATYLVHTATDRDGTLEGDETNNILVLVFPAYFLVARLRQAACALDPLEWPIPASRHVQVRVYSRSRHGDLDFP